MAIECLVRMRVMLMIEAWRVQTRVGHFWTGLWVWLMANDLCWRCKKSCTRHSYLWRTKDRWVVDEVPNMESWFTVATVMTHADVGNVMFVWHSLLKILLLMFITTCLSCAPIQSGFFWVRTTCSYYRVIGADFVRAVMETVKNPWWTPTPIVIK